MSKTYFKRKYLYAVALIKTFFKNKVKGHKPRSAIQNSIISICKRVINDPESTLLYTPYTDIINIYTSSVSIRIDDKFVEIYSPSYNYTIYLEERDVAYIRSCVINKINAIRASKDEFNALSTESNLNELLRTL